MEVIPIVATFAGFISVAKDLADIARELADFHRNVRHAKRSLEQYCSEVAALEGIQLSLHDTVVSGSATTFLRYHIQEVQQMVTDLTKLREGIRARLKIAWRDEDLRRILNVVERAKTTMLLVLQLQTLERQQLMQQDISNSCTLQEEVMSRVSTLQVQGIKAAASTASLERRLDALQREISSLNNPAEITWSRDAENRQYGHWTSRARPGRNRWFRSLRWFLCSSQASTIRDLEYKPRFEHRSHGRDSHVAAVLRGGTAHEIMGLLKAGEINAAHYIGDCFKENVSR